MKHAITSFITLLLLIGCSSSNSDNQDVADFSSLNGNQFVMEVDRVLGAADVDFPSDALEENDYETIDDGADYTVTFSENGHTVSIEPGNMQGQKTEDDGESTTYELDAGTFAGGRFVIQDDNGSFDAELTLYGSGVPIVQSERGYLVPVED